MSEQPYKKLKNSKGETIELTKEEYKEIIRESRRLFNLDIGMLLNEKHLFSSIMANMDLKWETSVPYGAMSIESNNFVLYLNPVNYKGLTRQSQRFFLLLHEMFHYIFKHPSAYRQYKMRMFDNSVQRLNYVTDLEINEQAADGNFSERIPGGLYVDEINKRHSLEMERYQDWMYYNEFYDQFKPEQENNKQKRSGNDDSDKTDDSQESDNNGSGTGDKGESGEQQQKGNSSKDEKEGKGENEFENAFVDEGSGVHPHDYWKENDAQMEKNVVKNSLKKAYEKNGEDLNKNPGRYPLGMKKIIEEIIEDKADYSRTLRNITAKYLRGTVKRKYSKEHLYITQESEGFVAKGKSHRNRKKCLVIKDTSGSVGEKELKIINGHVKRLLNQGIEVWVMDVDAEVQAYYQVNPRLGIKGQSQIHGGGGTSFCPPFEKIENEKLKFDVIIYLTDGYGSAPEYFPVPTIWLIFEGGRKPTAVGTNREITWGHFVFSQPEKA